MSWPRVALRSMPYPDINLVGLGVVWLGELPHEDDLTTWQNQANHTIMPKINYILQNAYGKFSNAPCMCQTGE